MFGLNNWAQGASQRLAAVAPLITSEYQDPIEVWKNAARARMGQGEQPTTPDQGQGTASPNSKLGDLYEFIRRRLSERMASPMSQKTVRPDTFGAGAPQAYGDSSGYLRQTSGAGKPQLDFASIPYVGMY